MVNKEIRVLCVEDDEVDRVIIKRAVKASGLNIQLSFAEDIDTGKELTNGIAYDCIFLDYNLPGGSGLELLKYIRSQGNESPIIIVTSQGDEKIAVEAMKNGAIDYIPKNLLSPEGLAQSLRYVLKMKESEYEKQRMQRELQETQIRLQAVVANSPIMLFLLDEKGCFTLFEGKGTTEFKKLCQNITGSHIDTVSEMLPVSKADYEIALSGKERSAIYEVSEKFFEVFYAPMHDEHQKTIGVIGVASDVTVHKLAEKELVNAKQLAEETGKMKQQFLANMSHEIRTPMNGIIGLTRILLNSRMDDEQMGYMQSIKTCSDNLMVIINDILDVSKIEAGKMTFESVAFKMNDLAKHTWELFSPKASEKNIGFEYEVDDRIPAYMSGDPTRLCQILNNLISNAIKFTSNGTVKLNAKLRSEREESITIDFEVSDSGIGIPEESLSSIFESFTQASSDTARKFGGTGLGLTIVKKLVELQGGTINVRSQIGKGTTFYFHLTFARVDESLANDDCNDEKDSIDLSHLSILIAEDNPINQMIVKKLFAEWKVEIDIAENGRIAVEKLQKKKFDIVLMDIQMPEMDGYAATEHIRTKLNESLRNIPIIAMTAHATNTEKEKSFEKGMNDYISKPFDPNVLRKKIADATCSSNCKTNEELKTVEKKSENSTPANSPISKNDTIVCKFEEVNAKTVQTNSLASQMSQENIKIDLAYLKQIGGNDPNFIIQMIEMFMQKTPIALEELSEKFKQQNWDDVRNIAHKIKPSYTYIGLTEVHKMLAEIENFSHSQTNLDQIPKLMEEVGQKTNAAISKLQEELIKMK